MIRRLEDIVTDDIKNIFNKKDSFIFLTLFDRFVKLEMDDAGFADFLREFQKNLRFRKRNKNGLLFDEIDKEASTKDKQVILDKLDILESLMLDFFGEASPSQSIEAFIAEKLDMDVAEVQSDMDFYNESLSILLENTVRIGSKLWDEDNRPSLLAMMVYSYKEDKDLEKWMTGYAKDHHAYFADQNKNFSHMKQDFERFCSKFCA